MTVSNSIDKAGGLLSILEDPLLRGLLNETIPFHEVMNAFGIRVIIGNLPSSISGFIYLSRKGYYHLILNGNLAYEAQCRTFVHELKHIVSDSPRVSYYIGIDKQKYETEVKADRLAEAISQYRFKL